MFTIPDELRQTLINLIKEGSFPVPVKILNQIITNLEELKPVKDGE